MLILLQILPRSYRVVYDTHLVVVLFQSPLLDLNRVQVPPLLCISIYVDLLATLLRDGKCEEGALLCAGIATAVTFRIKVHVIKQKTDANKLTQASKYDIDTGTPIQKQQQTAAKLLGIVGTGGRSTAVTASVVYTISYVLYNYASSIDTQPAPPPQKRPASAPARRCA